MKKTKIGIVGHFGLGKEFNDGQTVKTKNLYNELSRVYGLDNIYTVDTYNWKKNPFKLLKKCISIMKKVDFLLILPAQNGVKIFLPMFVCFNRKKRVKIFYVVVGGWLPELLNKKKKLINDCKSLDMIFVETSGMLKKLNKLGIKNVDILVNFKDLNIKEEKTIIENKQLPIKVCTFSRVLKEKGIENAINAIKYLNNKYKETIYMLDIYGPIDNNYKLEFESLIKNCPKYINYCGVIQSHKSVEIMKDYILLLFPTYYAGEGLAGTIIDAYSAGIPVVASDWKYNKEVVKNEKTGFIFETKNDKELIQILDDVYNQKYDLQKIGKNCLKEANKYLPSLAIKNLTKYMK